MGVITVAKKWDDILRMLIDRGDLPVVVVGCGATSLGCTTGGRAAVRALQDRVRDSGVMTADPARLPDSFEQALCDPTATSRYLEPLAGDEPVQVLVQACGAGLRSVREALPSSHVVPALDTVGVGVGEQLACIACGDCGFGRQGCKMVRPRQRQAGQLAQTYGKGGGH